MLPPRVAQGLRVTASSLSFIVALCLACGPVLGEEDDPVRVFEQGESSMKARDYAKAVKAFSRALELFQPTDRNYHVVMVSRAHAYFKMGDLNASWTDVKSVMAHQSLDGETRATGLVIRGMINLRRNREQEALRDLTNAIKTQHDSMPLRAVSFAQRGVAYISVGEVDKAVSDLNQAVRLDHQSPVAYAGRGLAHLRKDRIENARSDAEKALSLNPDEETAKTARSVLQSLTASYTGPDRVSVPIGDDGHIFVQVRFTKDGKPHRFLLDTGATYSLVSKDLMEKIRQQTQVREIGKGRVMTADGALHTVSRYKVKDVFLYNLPLGEIEVHVFAGKVKTFANLLGARSLKGVSISLDTGVKKAEIRRAGESARELEEE